MKKLWLCSVLVMICGNMFANQGTLSDKGATNDSVIMIVFVAGIILGIAAALLTGISASLLIVILFGALLVMAAWLFKGLLLGKWWK